MVYKARQKTMELEVIASQCLYLVKDDKALVLGVLHYSCPDETQEKNNTHVFVKDSW
jgi:hypothetical protein